MKSYEMVEKLSEKAHVTLDTAKDALEKSNWDILDAAIYLEKNKVENPVQQTKSVSIQKLPVVTENNQQYAQAENNVNAAKENKKSCSFSRGFGKFCGFVKNICNKGMESSFVIIKGDKKISEIPVIAFIVLMLLTFEIAIPLMIVSLFFDYKYSFSGNGVENVTINDVMNKASSFTEQVKSEFKAGMNSVNN